jgi:hypothetical protein
MNNQSSRLRRAKKADQSRTGRTLIIVGIVLLALIAGVFWYVNNSQRLSVVETRLKVESQKLEMKNDMEVLEEQEQNSQEAVKKDVMNDQNVDCSKKQFQRFTEKEMTQLKREEGLVWYEVPEMNIKFLVTQEVKDDLRYKVVEDSGQDRYQEVAHFYSLNFAKFKKNDIHPESYTQWALVRVGVRNMASKDKCYNYNRDRELLVYKNKKYGICYAPQVQASNFSSKEEMERYNLESSKEGKISERRCGMYLGALKLIK